MKNYLKLAFILFLSASVFFGASYFYLYISLEKEQKAADSKQEKIPYLETPESKGLLFTTEDIKAVLFFLDFEGEVAYIINISNHSGIVDNYAGYRIDYSFGTDYYVLSSVFDRLGGLDLDIDGEYLRYTGVQVCDILAAEHSTDISLKIVTALCEKISENGFSTDDFIFLIENTTTNLTVPDCIYWQGMLKNIFSNAIFVNWEI